MSAETVTATVAEITATVTRTVSAATASSTDRAPSQAGILEGVNPLHVDPKNPLTLFIVQAGIIIIFCRLLNYPLGKIRQPRVIAEVLAGILLGPSVMGQSETFTKTIFPTQSMPALNLAANLGLVLFLFLVGLEVDLRFLVQNWRIALSVGALGMALPFGLGAAIAYGLYHQFREEPGLEPISFGTYLLFIGVAMAITAFPVLCRILTELKLLSTPVGVIVLSAGVGNDVVGWILLALCVALVNAGSGITALYVLLVAIGWTLFLIYGVRPAFMWVLRRTGSLENGPSQGVVALTVLMVLVSSFFTSIIGVHAIFGAFIVGLICPHEGGFAIKLTEKIEDLVSVLLLPLYFALSGLSTNLGLLNDGITWAYVIGVIAIAFFAKIAGGTLAARFNGLVWRESLTIGVLMSCKGLVELIVLNIGLNARILSQKTFTIFVVMALVTTFATTPLVKWLYPYSYQVKLTAWKRGEIDWEGNRLQPEDGSSDESSMEKVERPEIHKVLAYLRLDNVSGVMALCSLIAGPLPSTSTTKIHPKRESAQPPPESSSSEDQHKRPLQVHGVRLTELTDRDSSVMRVSEADEYALRDPVVNTFRSFGQLRHVSVSGGLLIAYEPAFAATLSERAESVSADMLLLPWSEDGSMTDSHAPSAPTTNNKEDRFTGEYSKFVTETLFRAPCATAVFVDNGLGGTNRRRAPRQTLSRTVSSLSARSIEAPLSNAAFLTQGHHVFMPFFGSEDDALALRLVLQMARDPSVTASILRFDIPDQPSPAHAEPEIAPARSPSDMRSPRSPQYGVFGKTERNEPSVSERRRRRPAEFVAWFAMIKDTLPAELEQRVLIDTVSLPGDGEGANVLNEVVARAAEECGQVARSAGDIVVMGRNRGLKIPGQDAGESKVWMEGEAGLALGPVAGAMGRGNVNASWVVVGGGR